MKKCYVVVQLSVVAALLLAVACTPAGERTGDQVGSASPAAATTLRMGMHAGEEPSAERGGLAYNGDDPGFIFHSALTIYDSSTGVLQPWLAERVPTVENGDWVVFPDGRMEVTWKLRPNVLWHDGTPLTAEDFVFGFKVTMDPELFTRGTAVLRSIESAQAPDAQTLVVRWKEPHIFANDMALRTLVPVPRHLIGNLYDTESKERVAANPYWMSEFIGVGPYRLTQYQPGSIIEGIAFDQYFLGRPKIDRVSIRYYGDTNTLVVSTIAGDLDVIPKGSLKQEEAHVLNTQWGTGSVILSPTRLRVGTYQFRDSSAPWVEDPRVRLALVKLIDRQGLVDTILNGLSGVWDIPLPREDPAYRLAQQRGLPNLSYDVPEAHRLLAAAGWSRGPDGMYRSQRGGTFAIELLAQNDINYDVQELLSIGDYWKTAGIDATTNFVSGRTDWQQAASKVQGVYIGGIVPDYTQFLSRTTKEITSESNRWRGSNFGGYSNPAYDQLVDRLYTTFNASERDQIAAELVKIGLDQTLYLPVTLGSDVAAVRKGVQGVTGVIPAQRTTGWNVHVWTLR
jgi:peptide/nickel transport system substrate-binding protein